MNLADPELELVDPTPNIHSLFVHFDELFFWTRLMGRALVRWSKRMYSCAGVCSYEGPGGLCDIALSEPLLKLRPRKDLVETLLHEMIHAYLFVTNRDSDRDGHGPNFQAHMHRINRAAGINITIYHDFHDEVRLYQKHWWRCNGRCQKMKPYFGIVRRSTNRAPGPHDYWWAKHAKLCGGTFIKIKEPEKPKKATRNPAKSKINADITKYTNNNKGSMSNKNLVKDNKENAIIHNVNSKIKETPVKHKPTTGKGQIPDLGRKRTNSVSVVETVRNVWANKEIPSVPGSPNNNSSTKKANSTKLMNSAVDSPPKKIKKIDEYFKKNASSILKEVYGEEYMISQSHNNVKLAAVKVGPSSKAPPPNVFVFCPNCNSRVYSNDINKHLDECLNRDIIEKLSKDTIESKPVIDVNKISSRRKSKDYGEEQRYPNVKLKTETNFGKDDRLKLKNIVGNLQPIPPYKSMAETTKSRLDSGFQIFKKELCASCGDNVYEPMKIHQNKCLGFFDNNDTIPEEGLSKIEKVVINNDFNQFHIKSGPIIRKGIICPCCGEKVDTSIMQHLDECFKNNIKFGEGLSKIETVVINNDFNPLHIKSEPGISKAITQTCPCCGEKVDKPIEQHLDECLRFFRNNINPDEGFSKIETVVINDDFNPLHIKSEPSCSKAISQTCPCCGGIVDKPIEQHLEECLGFFENKMTTPTEGSGTEIILIDDDDDVFDESQTLNATGTKSPCPCCLKMIEVADMNDHLDVCLSISLG